MVGLRHVLGSPGAVLLLLLSLVVVSAAAADKEDVGKDSGTPSSWYDGAAGFALGLEEALEEGRPLAVYFYTDWCGYCRQLERELLYRPEVEESMRYLTKVRINPEEGNEESAIARHYGVYGYPSFFVHPGPGQEATRLSGRVKRDGKWQMQTPAEFLETLRGLEPDE